jgi:hypothetical protein
MTFGRVVRNDHLGDPDRRLLPGIKDDGDLICRTVRSWGAQSI